MLLVLPQWLLGGEEKASAGAGVFQLSMDYPRMSLAYRKLYLFEVEVDCIK